MSVEREVLSYDGFGAAVADIASQVVSSGFAPEVILGVARGGLGLAMALGYALDVKALSTVNVEFYTGVDQRLDAPVFLPPTPSPEELQGLRVLVVDDVSDTGRTLALVRDHLADHVRETRTATVYEKPHTLVRADYVWRRTDRWIVFPWSAAPPLVDRGEVGRDEPRRPAADRGEVDAGVERDAP